MRAYVLSRLGQTALVVFLSLTAVFGLVRLSGDPVLLFMPTDIQAKDVDEFRERLGFNDPLALQYARFMSGAVRETGPWPGRQTTGRSRPRRRPPASPATPAATRRQQPRQGARRRWSGAARIPRLRVDGCRLQPR